MCRRSASEIPWLDSSGGNTISVQHAPDKKDIMHKNGTSKDQMTWRRGALTEGKKRCDVFRLLLLRLRFGSSVFESSSALLFVLPFPSSDPKVLVKGWIPFARASPSRSCVIDDILIPVNLMLSLGLGCWESLTYCGWVLLQLIIRFRVALEVVCIPLVDYCRTAGCFRTNKRGCCILVVCEDDWSLTNHEACRQAGMPQACWVSISHVLATPCTDFNTCYFPSIR